MYISSMSDVFEKFHLNIISDTLDQLGKSMKKRKLSSFDIEVNLNIYLNIFRIVLKKKTFWHSLKIKIY